jgi:putative spermidine/putrescine transport system ATP-binding protein
MDHGHIEQAASARDVYNNPLTAYVARFMGGQNVLAGRVSGVADGMIVLDLPERRHIEFPASDPVPSIGTTVHVSIRRDRIHLAKQSTTGATNTVSSTVRALEYQGTWVKVTLEGASSEDFVVHLPDTEFFADPVAPGDTVQVYWKPLDVHLLAGGAGRSDRPYASGQN